MRSDLYAHVLSLSPGSLEKNTSGDVSEPVCKATPIRAETSFIPAPLVVLADFAAAAVIFVVSSLSSTGR